MMSSFRTRVLPRRDAAPRANRAARGSGEAAGVHPRPSPGRFPYVSAARGRGSIQGSRSIQGGLMSSPRRYTTVLLLLFFASGCAALIYQNVWLQLLQLVIGSSAVSLGVLLGTFMGGMCLGSLLLPRYIDPRHHPLRVYAYLEIGIGVIGLLLLFGM